MDLQSCLQQPWDERSCIFVLSQHPGLCQAAVQSPTFCRQYGLFTLPAVHLWWVWCQGLYQMDEQWQRLGSTGEQRAQNPDKFYKPTVYHRKIFPSAAHYVVSSCHQIKPISRTYVEEELHIPYCWASWTSRCMWGTRLPYTVFFSLHCCQSLSFSMSLPEYAGSSRLISSTTA